MGLREAAEAARIHRDEEQAKKKEQIRLDQIARRDAKRAQRVAQANREAEELGFTLADHFWAERLTVSTADRLIALADDVWLEWNVPYALYQEPKGSWFVVDKCPSCGLWVRRGLACSSLAEIGDRLTRETAELANHHRDKHDAPLPRPTASVDLTVLVHAVAWRHKEPGEGAGGCEWDVQPGRAKERVAGILTDDDVEWVTRSFLVPGFRLDEPWRSYITDAIDTHFWADFYGDYCGPVLLEGWER